MFEGNPVMASLCDLQRVDLTSPFVMCRTPPTSELAPDLLRPATIISPSVKVKQTFFIPRKKCRRELIKPESAPNDARTPHSKMRRDLKRTWSRWKMDEGPTEELDLEIYF